MLNSLGTLRLNMKFTKHSYQRFGCMAAICAAAVFAATASAQTADQLLNKLVEKGYLTAKDAEDIKKEAQSSGSTAGKSQYGLMPDWVKSLKFSGDFRGRYDGIFPSDPDFLNRDRFQYRVRFGAAVELADRFEVGFKLSSADPTESFGGNPISGNTTLQNNGSKKFVYVDQAYAKWAPIFSPEFSGAFAIGKIANPFVVSENVFDSDYNPEGLSAQLNYKLNPKHTLKLNGGGFVLDELSGSSQDAYLAGGQLRFDSEWNEQWQTSFGLAGLGIINEHNLINGNVPNINTGNTRDASGAPPRFNSVVLDGAATYKVKNFPTYPGAFPITVYGEYMNNLAVSDHEEAFIAGLRLGKAARKRTWEVSYEYRYLGADAWYEELVWSDFGAVYQSAPANSGMSAGYRAGTNVRGHVVRAAYAITDSLTFVVAYSHTDLIHRPASGDSGAERLIADLLWKF